MIVEFMFVSVVCIGKGCDFMISNYPVPEAKCQQMKKDFLALPFKPEVTLAVTQCIKLPPQERI